MVENHNQKVETLIDYKIATLEAEKVSRDMELHYLNKWANAADAYINAMENEIKNIGIMTGSTVLPTEEQPKLEEAT